MVPLRNQPLGLRLLQHGQQLHGALSALAQHLETTHLPAPVVSVGRDPLDERREPGDQVGIDQHVPDGLLRSEDDGLGMGGGLEDGHDSGGTPFQRVPVDQVAPGQGVPKRSP